METEREWERRVACSGPGCGCVMCKQEGRMHQECNGTGIILSDSKRAFCACIAGKHAYDFFAHSSLEPDLEEYVCIGCYDTSVELKNGKFHFCTCDLGTDYKEWMALR